MNEFKSKYYDRQGNLIDLMDWVKKVEDKNYGVIKQDTIGDYFVSTIWLGIDYSYGDTDLEIFETMIFYKNKCIPVDPLELEHSMWRYPDEAAALRGHECAMQLVQVALHIISNPPNADEQPPKSTIGVKFSNDIFLLESYLKQQNIEYTEDELDDSPLGKGIRIKREEDKNGL